MRQNRPFSPVSAPRQPELPAPPARTGIFKQRLTRFYHRFRILILVSAGILIAVSSILVYDATRPVPQRLTQRDINAAVERALATAKPQPSYASKAYEVIRPSVVRIQTTIVTTGLKTEDAKTENALGTGFVFDDDGNILTSLHVVKDAAEIKVTFADGSETEATVVLAVPENDLAVLQPRVIPDDLQPAVLASAAMLRVGDEVVAVGNPFGISNSASAGVVSGLRRNFKVPRSGVILTNMIQFDAAVNPGNSGGPLVNRDGEVVGIVTGLLNPTEQDVFIGIGFAVTMETAAGALGSPPY